MIFYSHYLEEADQKIIEMLNEDYIYNTTYNYIDVLALRDVLRFSFNVLESLENYGVDKTIEKMNQENNQKDDAVWKNFKDTNSSLYKLDLSEYFMVNNQFRPIIGNIVIHRDNRHLTNSISKSFGPVFEEKIIRILTK